MKRWPRVVSPAVIPSTVSGTTCVPPSSDRIAAMEWSGRTQRRFPDPQRIDFGQGKSRIAASSTSATISGARRPGFSMTAKNTSAFLSARRSSWSSVRPVDRRKPSTAFSGASVRGPLRSSRTGFDSAVSPSIASARRRGVENAPAEA